MSKDKKSLVNPKDLIVRGAAIGMTRKELLRTFRIFPNALDQILSDPQTLSKIDEYRKQQFEILDVKITDLYEVSLEKLYDLLESPNPNVRLKAIKMILDSRFQFKPREHKLEVSKGKDKSTEDEFLERLKELRTIKGLTDDNEAIDVEFEEKDGDK